jgi:hypothetical protein
MTSDHAGILVFFLMWALAVACLSRAVAKPEPVIKTRVVSLVHIDPDEEYERALVESR